MIKTLCRYVLQHKWSYLSIALVLLVYDYTMLIPTQVIQRLVDRLGNQSLTPENFWADLLLLLGVIALNYVSAYYWHLRLFNLSVTFKTGMQRKAFRKMVFMRRPFYEKFRSGEILTRFSTDVEGLMDMVGYGIMVLLYAGGSLVFLIPAMFLISWQISLLAMVPLAVLMGVVYYLSSKQDKIVEDNREAVSALNDEVLESIEGIRVMRAYSKKATQGQQFHQRTAALAKAGDRIATYAYLYGPFATILIGLSTILILFFGAQSMLDGQISLGQVLALQLYMFYMVEPLWMFSEFILVYQTGKTSFKKLHELIETGDDLEPDGTIHLEQLEEIRFSSYSFQYPGAERASLDGIDWTVQAGQTIGIVGKTGSGKTTLIRQLLRQYPVGQGSFEINDRPATDYVRASIENKIGYVPQEHVLFSRNVADNIALGKKEASQEEILQAIATAAFSEDLERMPKGLETMIGERGVSISGGQKQRVSIARAFLKNPELLILDDSLSAVDAKTEQAIINNIQKERSGKTTLIISHRLSAVHHADWILVMDEGQIVEEGRAEDLLAHKGWYYEQYQRQQEQKGEEE